MFLTTSVGNSLKGSLWLCLCRLALQVPLVGHITFHMVLENLQRKQNVLCIYVQQRPLYNERALNEWRLLCSGVLCCCLNIDVMQVVEFG